MKSLKTFIAVLILVILTQIASAAEVSWIKLYSDFKYKDIKFTCESISFQSDLYLVVQVNEQDQVEAAKIVRKRSYSATKEIPFEAGQLSSIQVIRNEDGEVLVSQLPLNHSQLRFILYYYGSPFAGHCIPPSRLQLDYAGEFNFEFAMQEPGPKRRPKYGSPGQYLRGTVQPKGEKTPRLFEATVALEQKL